MNRGLTFTSPAGSLSAGTANRQVAITAVVDVRGSADAYINTPKSTSTRPTWFWKIITQPSGGKVNRFGFGTLSHSRIVQLKCHHIENSDMEGSSWFRSYVSQLMSKPHQPFGDNFNEAETKME